MTLQSDNGKIHGIMMLIIVPIWVDGKISTMAWISTGVVDEIYQKKGLGASLYIWAYRKYDLVGALSGNEKSIPINNKLGKSKKNVYMRRFLVIHQSNVSLLCQNNNNINYSQFIKKYKLLSDAKFINVDKIPSDYTSLWESFRKNFYLIVNRDCDYLIWRYLKAPFIKYEMLELRIKNRLEAFAIVRIQNTKFGSVMRVMELICNFRLSDLIWNNLCHYSAENGNLFTDFFAIGTCYDKFLEKVGFTNTYLSKELESIPHLLSPIEIRKWTNTFNLGGLLINQIDFSQFPEKNFIY